MRGKTWYVPKSKPVSRPKIPEEVRDAVDVQAVPTVARLKKRFCKTPKDPRLNWPHDFFARWHRDALYFVVVMRTGSDQFPEFETHTARMQFAGDGKFDLAVPMRRGWMTVLQNATPEDCLKEVETTGF